MQRLLWIAAISLVGIAAGQDSPGTNPAFPWPDGARAALSLSFDDARPSQVEIGLPLFERLDARVTFYVVSERVAAEPEGWRAAVRAGHEIGNHSRRHPCSGNFEWARERALESYTMDAMREELTSASAQIEKALGVRPTTFAYPCGQTFVGRGVSTASYVPLVAELFVAGRGWLDEAPNDPSYVDLAQLYGVSMDTVGFDELRPMLERTLEEGAWLVFGGHDIGREAGPQVTRTDTIEAVIAWAREPSRRIWLDTVGAVAKYVQAQQRVTAGARPAR